jgi:hypothetical protein
MRPKTPLHGDCDPCDMNRDGDINETREADLRVGHPEVSPRVVHPPGILTITSRGEFERLLWVREQHEPPRRLIVRMAEECGHISESICARPRRFFRHERCLERLEPVQQMTDARLQSGSAIWSLIRAPSAGESRRLGRRSAIQSPSWYVLTNP